MTEYTIKDIGHQRIVYADRQSIGACADEDSALKLIAKHSAAATRSSREPKAAGTARARPFRRIPHRLWVETYNN